MNEQRSEQICMALSSLVGFNRDNPDEYITIRFSKVHYKSSNIFIKRFNKDVLLVEGYPIFYRRIDGIANPIHLYQIKNYFEENCDKTFSLPLKGDECKELQIIEKGFISLFVSSYLAGIFEIVFENLNRERVYYVD